MIRHSKTPPNITHRALHSLLRSKYIPEYLFNCWPKKLWVRGCQAIISLVLAGHCFGSWLREEGFNTATMLFPFFPPRREGKHDTRHIRLCLSPDANRTFIMGTQGSSGTGEYSEIQPAKYFSTECLESNRTCLSLKKLQPLEKFYSKAVLTPHPLNNVSIAEFTSKQIREPAVQQTWGMRIKIWWYFVIKANQHTVLAMGLERGSRRCRKLFQVLIVRSCSTYLSCTFGHFHWDICLEIRARKVERKTRSTFGLLFFPKIEIKLPHL